MSRWFRHYAGMMRDEKLVRVALRAKQSIERVTWIWGAILESAAEVNDGGRFDVEAGEVAYFLRADEADILSVWAGLEAMGRIREGAVVKWGDRQFQSDTSAERQRRHRAKQGQHDEPSDSAGPSVTAAPGDGEVTAASRHGDAPEAETELEAEKKEDIRAVAKPTRSAIEVSFEELRKVYPKRAGADPKSPAFKVFRTFVAAGVDPQAIIDGARRCAEKEKSKVGTEFIPQLVKWLRDRRWEDYNAGAAEAKQCEARAAESGFYAADRSAELDAWDAHYRATKGINAPRDGRFGWRFETQWPPGCDPPKKVGVVAEPSLQA